MVRIKMLELGKAPREEFQAVPIAFSKPSGNSVVCGPKLCGELRLYLAQTHDEGSSWLV